MSDDTHPPDERARIQFEALALIDRRRYDQARVLIGQGLKEFPDDSEFLYLGAFVDYAQDHTDEAFTATTQLLARDPEHYGGRRLLAQLHEEHKQYAEAEEQWLGLLRDHPEDADLYGFYGHLMLLTLNTDKARKLALEGLSQEPDHSHCLFVATLTDLIEGRGSSFDATNLQRLLTEHPEHKRTAVALVIALNERGDFKGALRVGQELLRSQPDSQEVLEMVKALKRQSHWSMLPLYPMQRWGWGGAAAVTFGGLIMLRALRANIDEGTYVILNMAWLGYVLYSWIWPAVLKKLI